MAKKKGNTLTQRAMMLRWITQNLTKPENILVLEIMAEFGISKREARRYRKRAQDAAIANISKERDQILRDNLMVCARIRDNGYGKPSEILKAIREINLMVGGHTPKTHVVQMDKALVDTEATLKAINDPELAEKLLRLDETSSGEDCPKIGS